MADREDAAQSQIRDRGEEIKDDLSLIYVDTEPDEVFHWPEVRTTDGTLQLSTLPRRKVRIVLVPNAEELGEEGVTLDIDETYGLDAIAADGSGNLEFLKYSYTIVYSPKILLEMRRLKEAQVKGVEHWGDMLLTQRKFYRFDEEPIDANYASKDAKYRNQHPQHHFHPCVSGNLRLAISEQPSVLAVACFALMSFDYHRWHESARDEPRVLRETQKLLPEVVL